MIHIYGIKLDKELDRHKYELLLERVEDKKKEKIKRYRFYKDAIRSLTGDLLLRHGLKDLYGIEVDKLIYEYSEYGKPFLRDFEEIYFNISHSEDWVVCAISDQEVGIDVEHKKTVEMDIAKRFFAQGEYNDLMSLRTQDQLAYFYRLWTMKEAYVKAKGKGLSIPLDSFCIKKIDEKLYIENENNWRLHAIDIDKDYYLSVVGKSIEIPKKHLSFQYEPWINHLIESISVLSASET